MQTQVESGFDTTGTTILQRILSQVFPCRLLHFFRRFDLQRSSSGKSKNAKLFFATVAQNVVTVSFREEYRASVSNCQLLFDLISDNQSTHHPTYLPMEQSVIKTQ
jgi:hypothetical protein